MRRGDYRKYCKGLLDKIKVWVEGLEGGGFSWGGVEGWGEKAENCNCITIKFLKVFSIKNFIENHSIIKSSILFQNQFSTKRNTTVYQAIQGFLTGFFKQHLLFPHDSSKLDNNVMNLITLSIKYLRSLPTRSISNKVTVLFSNS